MAGILDPKKRFFDTYLTNEGRKQLATGELRMRFVSFSDGLTGYDQSEEGVIDSKDGSVFFESMSRPQDSIITENESIVNMMEVRSQDRQPAFLFQEVTASDGTIQKQPIRASMFGTQIYEPPNGKQILAVSSSGIDRKPIDWNANRSFFVSGSTTQQVFYDNSDKKLVGWWQFDMFQDQIASVSEAAADDSNLSFLVGSTSKVAQNEVPQSGLETNSAYFLVDGSGNNTVPASVNFVGQAIPYFVPANLKSFGVQEKSYVRLNTLPSLYPVAGTGFRSNEFGSQISAWIYLNEIDSPNNKYVFQLFDRHVVSGTPARKEIARVFINGTTLRFQLLDLNVDPIQTATETIADAVKPRTWHRISLAFNKEALTVVVDGNLSKSIRKTQPFSTNAGNNLFHLTSSSDLIIGNAAADANILKSNVSTTFRANSHFDGFIQECQYFLVPGTKTLPALISPDIISGYNSLTNKIASNNFTITQKNNHLISNRYNHEPMTWFDQPIESNMNLRNWINYIPIPEEVALYLAGVKGSKPFITEEIMQRGVKRVEMTDIIDRVEMVMSGTLFAYQDLRLLGHFDLNVSNEQQGLSITRRKFIRDADTENNAIKPGEKISDSPSIPRVFETKLDTFPMIESVFGQLNDYRKEDFIPHIRSTGGPAGGKFFEREATIYHLNEVIDNDFDTDDLTFSSSRLPNFMFLPPIARKDFKFREIRNPVNMESAMSWTEFLRRRAAGTAWFGTVREEEPVTKNETRTIYEREIQKWYQTLIPKQTIKNLLNILKPELNDSNEDLIRYLTRDVNDTQIFDNDINFSGLEQFSELITFDKTSEFNNSYVQMFEVSESEGAANFKKLAIRDLGVTRRKKSSYKADYRGRRVNNVIANFEDNALDALENQEAEVPELVHVFAFGKILHDDSDPRVPGTDVFFQPIFTIEFIIGDE